jgi:glutaredoxin
MKAKVRIVLYTKEGCGLCHEMKAEMRRAGLEEMYLLEEVDIRSDADLFNRYRYEIPVLFINGTEAFRHRLTSEQFREYLISLSAKQ